MRVALATGLAICAAALAGRAAWGHTFPPVRTVVVQVERCEVALLVGYRAGSSETQQQLVARVASRPKPHALDVLRDVLSAHAMAPLTLHVDGKPLVPTTVRAKVAGEGDAARPMVVLLVTYALPPGKTLALASKDPRRTRISWTDRRSGRVAIAHAPSQRRWFTGMASFLLPLGPTGGPACVAPRPLRPLHPSSSSAD
jgi:hypothetical protein